VKERAKTYRHASTFSPHLPPSSCSPSDRCRAQRGEGWRREIVWREIIILFVKQILLLVLKIFLFIEIVFFLFLLQAKLVLQIKFILTAIFKLSWISSCGSSSVQPLFIIWGKPLGGSLFFKEKLLLVP